MNQEDNLRKAEWIQLNRKRAPIVAICLLSLCICASFSSKARASDQADLLSQPIRAVSIKGETIAFALEILTSECRIPIGIELTDEKLSLRRKIDLDLSHTTVKGFLDSVVEKDPEYTWKLEGGVIHVWPVTNRDTLIASLLDTKISHFSVGEGTSRYRIHSDILDLPEIKTKLIVAGVEPMIFAAFGSTFRLDEGVAFEESDVTLRELLDKLAQQTKINRWVIRRWGDNNEFITITS